MVSPAPRSFHRFGSPLRYPGGKGALAPFVGRLIEHNNLYDPDYVEIYAGGAGIALSLLFSEHVSTAQINDIDPAIYSFWHSVLRRTDDLCDLIVGTPVNIDEWKKQKQIVSDLDVSDRLTLGFATFFLNRVNRSGIISGGVIGGIEQSGKWSIDARFNKPDLIRRIQRIAGYKDRIILTNLDASILVQRLIDERRENRLVYLDPPYFSKGRGLYTNDYSASDHGMIAKLVANLADPWIVSYDATPDVLRMYSQFESVTYDLSYSAQRRYAGSEVMFFSAGLKTPEVQDILHP